MALNGFLLITGLIFAALGVYTLADPQAAMDAGRLGLKLDSVAAYSQMRGAGGGTTLAVGLLLLASVTRASLERPALWAVVAVLGGLEAGRLVSLLVDGVPPPNVAVGMLFENLGLWQAVYWLQQDPASTA
ncbi:DUF4345 domain-containing protein [Solimonas sp. K1W22B-7]|uniref:DUF4345 domain-containing protein n=1 Tax=Solimonas sp. K1W22B-7 TaxID=2303331 RepID=UPI000E32D52C|nr:DUF4345 domain-containing protein [Solimonas sp. K1W22B-7]AXQ28652.1 DUF4345 domain-containing protein [Solimonas sp. K1W22B-7]